LTARIGTPAERSLGPLLVAALMTVLMAVGMTPGIGNQAGAAVGAAKAGRAATTTAPGPRATWVWGRPRTARLVRFATDQGVEDLFVSVPSNLPASGALGWYRDLRARTGAVGIRVHALGSDTSWLDDPASALHWQRDALSTGLFDGVHLDVEPWLHPDWRGGAAARDGLLRRYLDLLGGAAADTTLPVEADISFWLHQHVVDGRRVDEAVLARVDAVTVMTYRDTATGPGSITALGAAALDAAARAGKRARLAVETNWLGDDAVSRKQTFFGSSRAALASALATVDGALRDHAAYAGVSVHDVAGWQALPTRRPSRRPHRP
jgi:hypothetical protein